MARPRLSKAEARILEQCWKLGTCSVREILDSLPEDEQVAYTTVQTLVYRLEQKGALRRVVAASLAFVVPVGALLDKIGSSHLAWARPLGIVGDLADRISYGVPGLVVGTTWLAGATVMLVRLCLRLRAKHRKAGEVGLAGDRDERFAGAALTSRNGSRPRS